MAAIDPARAMTVAVPAAGSGGTVASPTTPRPAAAPTASTTVGTPPATTPPAGAARSLSSTVLLASIGAVAAAVVAAVVLAPTSADLHRGARGDRSPPAAEAATPVALNEPAPSVSLPSDPAKAAAVPAPPPKNVPPATPAPPTATAVAPGTKPPAKTAPGTPPATPVAAVATGTAPAVNDTGREAATRLEVARAKLGNNLTDQGLADLRAIVTDFPATAVAADASYLTAETLARLGRIDDAMAAHVEFANRFAGDARVAESQFALAELTLKSRQPNREESARAIYGRAAATAPGSPTALRALQAKAGIEERRRLRERNAAIGREVPAQLATLRTLADQFPDSPHGMLALYRLGPGWADLDQWTLAAGAYTDLATRYPANPHDAWWQLGEIYERRLRDDERAKAAYAQVPPTSKRYQDAQRKLSRR